MGVETKSKQQEARNDSLWYGYKKKRKGELDWYEVCYGSQDMGKAATRGWKM
jgi:hypothetical protein